MYSKQVGKGTQVFVFFFFCPGNQHLQKKKKKPELLEKIRTNFVPT